MSRIDNASRIAEILRRQVGDLQSDQAARQSNSPSRSAQLRGQAQSLEQVVSRRLQAIDAADPERRQKAFKVFLESVLLAELGEQLLNDPAFYQLVDKVQAQMQADEGLREAMAQAADWLLSIANP